MNTAELQAERRKMLKSKGLCVRCGKSKTTKFVSCDVCRESHAQSYKKWRASKKGKAARRKADAKYKASERGRLVNLLRTRLRMAIRNDQKAGSAVRDLGCSIPELIKQFESQFQPGMSMANHGEWQIDHIKPLASFDLTDREQLKQACHFTNLQPLWAKENDRKGRKF